MKPNNLLSYHFIRKIGKGGFSDVFLVRARFDHKLYAMKKVFIKSKRIQRLVYNEIKILRKLRDNRYVVNYCHSFTKK